MAYALQGKLDMNAFLIAYMMDMLLLVFVHASVVVEHAFVFLLIKFMLRVHACMFVCVRRMQMCPMARCRTLIRNMHIL